MKDMGKEEIIEFIKENGWDVKKIEKRIVEGMVDSDGRGEVIEGKGVGK